jgi:hypothetical protein
MPMLEDQDLVPVASFENLSEAEVARNLLEAEGIAAVLQDQPLASLLPPIAAANGGLSLLVAPDAYERAREVLAEPDDTDAAADRDAEALSVPEASGDGGRN